MDCRFESHAHGVVFVVWVFRELFFPNFYSVTSDHHGNNKGLRSQSANVGHSKSIKYPFQEYNPVNSIKAHTYLYSVSWL